MKLPVYMDNHATTPVDLRVLKVMLPYFGQAFGNASSRSHCFGWEADAAVEVARSQIAMLIGASPKEVIYTSGATESDNLAIKGIAWAYQEKGRHIVTLSTEHRAVLDSCRSLEEEGFKVTYVPVRSDGLVELDSLAAALTNETTLVSIMAANNEIGVLQPIREIGKLCRERGILFHTDGSQAAGKIPIDVKKMNIDLMSISSHKMYGPKGTGVLYVRRKSPRVHLKPIIHGGGHERGLRSGTLNVPAIVGFGKACEICQDEMPKEIVRLCQLRDRLKNGVAKQLDHVEINGSMDHRLPNNLNLSFGGIDIQLLLMEMRDVALSSSASCTTAAGESSHVLRELGLGDLAYSSLRIGLGRFNTDEEVDYVVQRIVDTVRRLRQLSPLSTKNRRGHLRTGPAQ